MSGRVLYRHGPFAGQVLVVDDDVYRESLLATGYAVEAPADAPVAEPVAVPVPVDEPDPLDDDS